MRPSCFLFTLNATTQRQLKRSHANIRFQSHNALHFYRNRQLELYAVKEARPLTLRQLVFFGRSMKEERLIKSANYVRTELPIRIAHRLRDLQTLPYVVVTREGVARVYELYWSAFEKLRKYPQIDNLEDNKAFCIFLRQILDEHAPVIPSLSLGLSLSSPNLVPERLDSFMRRMLVSRISRRVLAEHHLALSSAFHGQDNDPDGGDHVGIIYTGLKVRDSIERCARLLREGSHHLGSPEELYQFDITWPHVVIDGHVDTRFSYIREHLEYIIFELLKNSMRATGLKHAGKDASPEVRATIVASKDDVSIRISDQGGGILNPDIKSPSDLFSFSHVRNATRLEDSRLGALRSVSSSRHGMMATVAEQLGTSPLQQAAPEQDSGPDPERSIAVGRHMGIGIGLPMSNIYARYFGGSLELVSLDGWGTDVYVRLPKLGTNLEGIEV